MNIRRIAGALVALVAVICISLPSYAADSAGFTVTPVLPENQNPETRGYFDLTVAPGQVQTLTVSVNNKSNEDITVSVQTITATTNRNGIINYTTQGPADETLAHSFAEFAKPDRERLTVPAYSALPVTVTMTAPEEPFQGLVLGSIQVTRELTEKEKDGGGMILNQYSYVLGVRLMQDRTPLPADFLLGEVEASLTNKRASIVANVRNPLPVLVKGMDATVQIVSQKNGKTVFERTSTGVDMAPNSVFPFTLLDSAGYGIQAGPYVAKVRLEYQGNTWDFEQAFAIEAEQAAMVNESALNQGTRQAAMDSSLPLWAVITIGASVLLLAGILIAVSVLLKRQRSASGVSQAG